VNCYIVIYQHSVSRAGRGSKSSKEKVDKEDKCLRYANTVCAKEPASQRLAV